MTLERVIWQAQNACEFTVVDEGSPFTVKAQPVVTSNYFGITVGFFFRTTDAFGHWQSSTRCDLLTAWRAAQILPRVKTLHVRDSAYYNSTETLSNLVTALRGDNHEDRTRDRSRDLGMTEEDLNAELQQLNERWPTAGELYAMWDRLPDAQQETLAPMLFRAVSDHHIEGTPELTGRLDLADLRLRNERQQKQHEAELIEAGLHPEVSLRQFLLDLGVTNLMYTVGCGEMFDPTHFNFDDLDRVIMRELIGERGFCGKVELLASAKQPDDPSAHYRSNMGPGMTAFWSDFGEYGHPRLIVNDKQQELVFVHWDRVTERFVLTVRPLGLGDRNDSEDTQWSIHDLRVRIGEETQLGHPLGVGVSPEWLRNVPKWRRIFMKH